MGFYLRKKETGHAGGRAVVCWARIWPCWARWAGLGADLALLGALGWVGRGIWLCWARWAGLGVVWLWWARWAGLGVGFGCAGRAGLGWVGFGSGRRWAGLGVGFGWAVGADLAFCVWSTLYMSSSCLHDVFVFIFMCISDVYHGA